MTTHRAYTSGTHLQYRVDSATYERYLTSTRPATGRGAPVLHRPHTLTYRLFYDPTGGVACLALLLPCPVPLHHRYSCQYLPLPTIHFAALYRVHRTTCCLVLYTLPFLIGDC